MIADYKIIAPATRLAAHARESTKKKQRKYKSTRQPIQLANSFGVFSTYYLNYIYPDISASNVAWVGTTISLFMLGGAVVTGPLTDRFGFRMIALSGTATCSLGLLLASFTSALWELVLTQGVMFGLGAACIFSPSVSLPAQWHVKRRPLATGIAVAGSGAGGMIFTQITQTMIEAIGHKWTLRVLALILLFVSGASGMFYKRRLPVPVGGTSLVSLAKDSRLIAVGCAGFFVNISYFVPWYYLPTAALQLGQTKQAANNLVLYMNAGSTVGRVLAAYVAIALGPINTNIFGAQAVTTAMGIMNMWCSIGALVGNPSQGAIYQSYDRPKKSF
ncbi:hypothetical protein H4217_007446, partial [Coemansia sp. RSA 1939]